MGFKNTSVTLKKKKSIIPASFSTLLEYGDAMQINKLKNDNEEIYVKSMYYNLTTQFAKLRDRERSVDPKKDHFHTQEYEDTKQKIHAPFKEWEVYLSSTLMRNPYECRWDYMDMDNQLA